MTMAHPRRPC